MFEVVEEEPAWVVDLPPDDDLDGELERMLARASELPEPFLPDEDVVPAWLDDAPPLSFANCAPSGWLGLDLDLGTADPTALSDEELIEASIGFDRMKSWADAKQAEMLAEFTRRRPGDPVPNSDDACVGSRYVPDEVGVALKLSRGHAKGRIGTACRLLRVLPATHALWKAGQIDTAKANAIADATVVLSDELAAAVEARVLPRAPQQTVQRLRQALTRAVLAVDPDGAAERHKQARKGRRVYVQPEPDGMGSFWALFSATDAAGAYTWLTQLARGCGKDDPRPMDVRRADIAADVLNGRMPHTVTRVNYNPGTNPGTNPDASSASDADAGSDGASGEPVDAPKAERSAPVRPVTPGKPLVQIVISYSTLIGADDAPAELVGYGPIPADLARDVATEEGTVWHRLITDPLSGTLLDYGRTTYRPPAALDDHVRARDQHCRFPHCRRRAIDAELDHVIPWPDGGETSEENLRALCVHHHKLKTHAPGWHVEAHPDGRLTWTTPTGHRHVTEPHDYRVEPPAAGPEPAQDPDPPPF